MNLSESSAKQKEILEDIKTTNMNVFYLLEYSGMNPIARLAVMKHINSITGVVEEAVKHNVKMNDKFIELGYGE